MEANIRDLNLGYTSHSYKRVHLTPGPMQTPETSKSHWLRREVTDISVVLFYTRCWVKSSYSNIKPFLFLFLPFILALAWKDHVIICLSRTIAKRGNPQIAGFVSKNSDLSINNTTLVGVVCKSWQDLSLSVVVIILLGPINALMTGKCLLGCLTVSLTIYRQRQLFCQLP